MRTLSVVVVVVTIVLCISALCVASVPLTISYQGKLMESSGIPVADGTSQMTFAIYDAESEGAKIWTETNTAVQVKGGLFSVLLGSVTPFPSTLFDGGELWFGVSIGSAAELSPRQKIASAAFAQVSRTVVDGAITVTKLGNGAVTSDKLAAQAVTTDNLANGAVGTNQIANGAVVQSKTTGMLGCLNNGKRVAYGWNMTGNGSSGNWYMVIATGLSSVENVQVTTCNRDWPCEANMSPGGTTVTVRANAQNIPFYWMAIGQ